MARPGVCIGFWRGSGWFKGFEDVCLAFWRRVPGCFRAGQCRVGVR